MKNYYRILDLEPSASEADIKQAYRRLAKQWHPDVNGAAQARMRFIEVNEAYEFLMDPRRRDLYSRRTTIDERERLRREMLYKQWVAQQQQQARNKAQRYAERPMDEFVNSPIYKAAMRVSHVYNYIFIAVGIIITFGPGIKYLMMTAEELEERQVTTASVVTPMIMGALFTYGIYTFLFKYNPDRDA